MSPIVNIFAIRWINKAIKWNKWGTNTSPLQTQAHFPPWFLSFLHLSPLSRSLSLPLSPLPPSLFLSLSLSLSPTVMARCVKSSLAFGCRRLDRYKSSGQKVWRVLPNVKASSLLHKSYFRPLICILLQVDGQIGWFWLLLFCMGWLKSNNFIGCQFEWDLIGCNQATII